MKCCSAQIASCWEDPAATLDKIRPCISNASERGSHLIAFPEQFATGWDPCSRMHIEDISGTIVSTLTDFARDYSIAILGSYRQAAHPLPKNTALVIFPDGSIRASYAKIHPFAPAGEERCYASGSEIAVFGIAGVRLGLAICYDLRFPDLFRIYADHGVHGVIVPSAWPKSRLRHWELFIRARAAENQMYVVGINTTGDNPVDTYAGCSMTAGPDGSVISRAGEDETLLCSDLDASVVDTARARFPVHKDRRLDLYSRL